MVPVLLAFLVCFIAAVVIAAWSSLNSKRAEREQKLLELRRYVKERIPAIRKERDSAWLRYTFAMAAETIQFELQDRELPVEFVSELAFFQEIVLELKQEKVIIFTDSATAYFWAIEYELLI